MATDSGYSNQKKLGIAQFETIHPMGSNSFGKSTLSKSVYDIQITMAIASVEEELGIDGQVRLWILEIGGHSAVVGNLLKFDPASSLPNFYFEVMEVRNFDKIAVLPIAEALPQVGDTVDILGFVTSKLTPLGESIVSIAPTPILFTLDGADQEVTQDTIVPANNNALPNLNFIIKDGVQVPVVKDTATPANTVGMPVEIVAASGTPINITAGDLNVQLSDQGVNADVVRIGDGTTQLGITLAGEALVHDQDVLNSVNDLLGQIPSVLGQNLEADSLSVVLASDGVLPLPTGAAEEATLIDVKTAVETLAAVPGAKLIPFDHDEIVTTYVGVTSKIDTVTYKLATVTVATLTMSYDGSDRLTSVVRS